MLISWWADRYSPRNACRNVYKAMNAAAPEQPDHKKLKTMEKKNILYLIRGIPGSGKTTLARHIAFALSYPGVTEDVPHLEADKFFVNPDTQEYIFDKKSLDLAHTYCRVKTEQAMQSAYPIVIVSNCFIKQWELEPYYLLANLYGYHAVEIVCKGNFKSIHDVPQETIDRMRREFQYT